MGLKRRNQESVEDSVSSGSAVIKLGPYRKSIQVMYNVATASDITVEVSNDGSDWDPHDTLGSANVTAGSEQSYTGIPDTAYSYARVSYGGTDGDITELKIVGK